MIRRLLGIAQPETSTPTPTEPEPRTSATVRLELQLATEADKSLTAKTAEKQAEVAEARNRFDRAMESHVLAGIGDEPSRGEIDGISAQLEALSRIAREKRQTVTTLRNELADLDLREAIESGLVAIPALKRKAEALLAQFETTVQQARALEADLRRVLFDQREGLRQNFPADLNTSARQARFEIRRQIEQAARKSRISLHPTFETDGEPNYGSDQAWYLAQITLPPKVHAVPYDTRECGALEPETIDHRVVTETERFNRRMPEEFVSYDPTAA